MTLTSKTNDLTNRQPDQPFNAADGMNLSIRNPKQRSPVWLAIAAALVGSTGCAQLGSNNQPFGSANQPPFVNTASQQGPPAAAQTLPTNHQRTTIASNNASVSSNPSFATNPTVAAANGNPNAVGNANPLGNATMGQFQPPASATLGAIPRISAQSRRESRRCTGRTSCAHDADRRPKPSRRLPISRLA